MIIIIVLVLIGLFVLLASNNDPCTTAITTCVYSTVKGNGIITVNDFAAVAFIMANVFVLANLKRNR
jgi:hypothetical protein